MLSLFCIITSILLNVLCIWSITLLSKEKGEIIYKNYLKYVSGGLFGLFLLPFVKPNELMNIISFMLVGAAISEMFWIFCFAIKRIYKNDTLLSYYYDGSPSKYYVTGDKHRNFDRVKAFCNNMNTRRKDVLIILGDSGFNYYDDKRDDKLKKNISKLNITLFCLHGNKENRPQNVGTYGIRSFCGGKVYYEPKYPNIFFAIDGEIYNFEGKKYMVVGGAHSVDKFRCLEKNKPFWYDEMPDREIKKKVEERLAEEGNSVYGMMTHTCPIDRLPTEMFMSTRQNAAIKRKPSKAKSKNLFKPDIDRSTEIWLGELEKKLEYTVWFCGHYHIDKQIDKIYMMCHDIRPLHLQMSGDENAWME